jgi:ABC-2 type transport system ATP-binding protein
MVATLSKGMRQRLCLAKTLVHDPRVLILDEPASALDPRARIEMRGLLKELGRMGKTIIISSHILTELSDLCTSVAILEKGRLVESGNVALLGRKQVRADRIKITLHEPRPELADVLAALPSVSAVNAEDGRILFDYTGAPEDFYKVVKELTDREAPLLAVEREARNLEHLFLELTEGDVQ